MDWQLERHNGELLLGIPIPGAVLDIVSTSETIAICRRSLETPVRGVESMQLGRFGDFPVRVNYGIGDDISMFVEGPRFNDARTQSAAIWLGKQQLYDILRQIEDGLQSR